MKKFFFIVTLLVTLVFFSVGVNALYTSPPEINTTIIELGYGEEFTLDKIKTSDDVTSKDIIKGEVNNQMFGEQTITVKVTNNHNMSVEKEIKVIVVDNVPPTITVVDTLLAEAKGSFNMKEHIEVSDNVDKNVKETLTISEFSTNKVGEQEIVIIAKDSHNNETKRVITLKTIDSTKPSIQAEDKVISIGDDIDLRKGITAEDNYDGDLTSKIEFSADIDINTKGNYPVLYKVKDRAGNEAVKKITITVIGSDKNEHKPSTSYSRPVTKENSQPRTQNNSQSVAKSEYAPMTIYFNGKKVPYVNGGKSSGQKMIDSGWRASTWGGASTFNPSDGMNTHFIGHNPGPFTGIQNANSFIITDSKGKPYTYNVSKKYKVDDFGVGLHDNTNHWSRITGTGGGERITFQSCIDDTTNWIIEALPK